MSKLALALVLTIWLAEGPRATAQAQQIQQETAQPLERKDEIIRQLIGRIEALEQEVAALKAAAPVPAPLASQAPLKAAAAAAPPAPLQPLQQSPEISLSNPAAVPMDSAQPLDTEQDRFTFRGFADVDFLRNVDGDSTKRFALGEIDLFATARMSPRLNALLETVFETDNQVYNASVPLNIERMLLQYQQNDYFNLDIGAYRTALGYYSTAYLRAGWLRTAISMPELFTFEDDGGFLPLHNVGLSANGKIPSGPLGLHYVAEVGSSRNYANNAAVGLVLSQNGAFNLALISRPEKIRGLEAGFSSYHDRFAPVLGVQLDRAVWAAHVVYVARRIEFLNEGVWVKYRDPNANHASITGFYSQFAYRVASVWRPYFRVENVNAAGHLNGGALHQWVPYRTVVLGGVRYDLSDNVALKFEVGRQTDWLEPAWIRAAMQLAFTF